MTSKRPAARRSSLAGQSPVAAPAPQPEAEPAPAPAEAATPVQPAPAATSGSTNGPKKHRHKVSFYQDEDDTDRVRGALLHTMANEPHRTLTDFIHAAVMEKVERLEAKYNGGNPFPPVKARELPQGRPFR